MEFNRRVADHTPPLSKFTPPPLPPPGFSYFPNQSMPAGHMGRGLTDSYKLEGPNSAIEKSEFIRKELEIGKIREEVIQSVLTQIQKERIRDEIIVDEILRRRFMKADVERELSIERELALPGLLPHEIVGRPQLSLPHEMMGRPRGLLPHEMMRRPIGENCASSLDGGTIIEGKKHHLAQKKNLLTFCCDVVDKHKAGNKHRLAQKKRLFRFWCDLCQIGTYTEDIMEKHKAGSKHHLAQKKRLFECWCDVCQIGTNSETLMEIHKAGKKHLANKKQLLRFWCDECQIGTDTENVMEKHKAGSKHLSRLQEINQNPGDEPPNLVMLPIKEAEADSLDLKNSFKLLSLSSEVCMKEDEAPVQRTKESRGLKKNFFKYWCDICQLGTDSEEVLKNHKYGKKHQAQLQKCSSSTGGDKR